MNPYRTIQSRIIGISKDAELEWTFRVETSLKPCPGQFFQLSLPTIGEAPISVSGFGDGWVDFTIRRVGNLTNAIHGLKSGDSIFIRGPYGKGFPIDKFTGTHLVIAAGGSGLAPVKPLISKYFDNQSELKGLDILLGFKNPGSVIFPDEIKKWKKKFNVVVTVDRGDNLWKGKTGLITERVKEMNLPEDGNVNVVVVGPPAMMKFTAAEFVLRKIPQERIWVSFERLMSCGIGKCGHCKIDYHYVCLDGPVMNYSMAARLID